MWIKRAGLVLIGFSVFGIVLERMVDLKQWTRSQWAAPSGPAGWLVALALPMITQVKTGHRQVAELLQLRPDDELVEVACGSGVFLNKYAGQVGRVAGLDCSDIQVSLARRRLRDRISAGTAEIVQGDPAALPWEDNSFTAASCLWGHLVLSDPAVALREMERVLRPGGRIGVTIGIDEADEACVRETEWWGIPHPPEAETRKMVEDAGFSLVSVSYHDSQRYLQGVKPE